MKRFRYALAFFFFLSGWAQTDAQAPAAQPAASRRRLTIEDVLRWRIASQPTISPDGKRVAFLLTENDFEQSRAVTQLWWVDTDSRQTRKLTHVSAGVAAPRWSPDGRWLSFLTARPDGERPPRLQVWLLPVDGGEAQPLTRAPQGVTHYEWAADSKGIFYVANEPVAAPLNRLREEEKKRKTDSVLVDDERPRRGIWRIILGDRREERLYAGDPGIEEIVASPDGKWLVYRSNLTGDPDHDRQFNLWLLDLSKRIAKQLTRRDGRERSPVWSADSSRVAFLAPRVPEIVFAQEEVFVVPAGFIGDPPEPQQVTRDFSGNIERLFWPSGGEALYFAAAVRTGNRLFRLNPAEGTARPASNEALFLSDAHWSSDASSCVALVQGPDTLPDIMLLRPASTLVEPVRLTQLNTSLKDFALGAQEVVQWNSPDSTKTEGILVKPPDWKPGTRYPLLLLIHGGPYSRRANTLLDGNLPQVWAARGWLVLQPNFRGSSAYGHEFGIASRGDIGGKDYDDILSGVDYAIAQFGADESRMAVMGGSYGGFMTNHIIGRTQRFKAAVSMFGIFSLVTDYSNSDFPAWELNYLGKPYWEAPELYAERSPSRYVTQINTPVLILHGEEDNNTFISNSKEMYQALKALGRTTRFVRFPREGHGFREPNHRIEEFRMIAAWLDEHALGRGPTGPRIVNEKVTIRDWELRVGGVRTPESYAGVRAQGRFVEVEFVVRATSPITERFSLLIFDTAGTDVSLQVTLPEALAGRPLFPLGVAAESLGQRVLVRSSAQVAALLPDRDGLNTAMAVAVVFDAPPETREVTLRVKEFPPITIQLPTP